MEACLLRFMSVRVYVKVRDRTLARSADFVRVRVRSLKKSHARVRFKWTGQYSLYYTIYRPCTLNRSQWVKIKSGRYSVILKYTI